ncbi:lymphatic vessel endothelial hyaluronic receptor 1b isoform X2 [Esox lucius]|uniref:lymphatic vessel endothelial hyaluronic receptor 1b isoform X2 n=1 Tax=Esox lucius TaxID=8010 RepID=UPI001476CAE2|nr:lymphatic vessel endothelial hyaluronic receptor 1b isoform X2 [Esox lucius]
MERVWLFSYIVLTMAVYALAFEYSYIKVFPKDRVSRVSMVSYGNRYALNASQARAMCLFLNVTIATRQQVETAYQHGLETCGFGWIDEQIAVIPRIVQNPNCGKNKTGVLPWKAPPDQLFHVFCFTSADLEIRLEDQTTTTRTVLSSAPATTNIVKKRLKTTPRFSIAPAPDITSKSSTQVPRFPSLMDQSTIGLISTPPPPLPSLSPLSSQHSPTSHTILTSSRSLLTPASSFSLPQLLFLSATSSSLISFPPQNTSANISESSEYPQSVNTAHFSIGSAVWYYKTTRGVFPMQFCRAGQQNLKDDIETEMWRHNDSETDLQDPEQTDLEENEDIKSTSDIVIINPGTKTNELTTIGYVEWN